MLEIVQIPVLTDNYIYLLHEPEQNFTAVVDPALTEPVLDALHQNGWILDCILNTHHHWDHVGANLELKAETQCQIWGAEVDQQRIPGLDKMLKNQEEVCFGAERIKIFHTPGHTLGHIVYFFQSSHVLFSGDTLFSMGCGRLFEGTPEQMWTSLQLIKGLPKDSRVYCAHEYTQANASFAKTIEPENPWLKQRIAEVEQLRAAGLSTIPTCLETELNTNPFLRADCQEIKKTLGMLGSKDVATFARIRELKDQF